MTIAICMAICIVVAYFLVKFILIIGTSFVGSYSIIYVKYIYLQY
jgi:hypothetical protein